MLLGTFEHTIDEKQRLTLPSKLRNKLGNTVYVSKGFEGCLEVRNESSFQKWYSEISSFSNTKTDARLLSREILANSSEIDIDSAGRIKIPGNLLDFSFISKNVFILGLGEKIEIWDKNKYQKYLSENAEKLESVADNMGGV